MLLFALFLTMASVSADDSNQTDVAVINNDSDYGSVIEDDSGSYSATNLSQANQTTSPLKASFDAVEKENYIKNKTFSVKLLDENRKGLANKTVQFTLDGKVFNSITDKNGNAKLTLNVDKGTYTVKYSFNEVGYKAVKGSKKILVIGSTASKIAASDFTAYSTIINYYKVTLTVDGMPLSGRTVKFTINGKSYTNKTNSKGATYLAIGLKKGVYTVKYSFAGETNIKKVSDKSKVTVVQGLPKKITKANSVIYRHNTLGQFKIKLKDARGYLLKNKKVTFTINKKKYTKRTDKNGIATLDIKLKKGTYKLKVYSGKTAIYNKVSKTYTVKVKPKQTRNNGVWLFGADMHKVNLKTLEKYGTKHIFLNFKALELWGQSDVEKFIDNAHTHKIKVHLWMQVFYMGGKWYNPVKKGKINYDLIKSKVNLAKKYAKIKGVDGIHFDYLRYPGTAYKYKNSVKAINYFTKTASNAVHKINSSIIVSAAVMPEPSSMKYYYGQDIPTMSKYLDVIVPMVYKGNYNAGASWIKTVTKLIVKKSNGAKIWTGLQSYRSDSNVKKISASELMNDAFAASMGGAYGVILFRFGVTNFINFNDV
ncbi:putative glycoside hydrolase [Methanobrevibacter sp.]|uniref:putative glycoside hydrolase n=1 Tax=Methanobrevibacter sp. TaxID=66852 RepID=UPI00386B316D